LKSIRISTSTPYKATKIHNYNPDKDVYMNAATIADKPPIGDEIVEDSAECLSIYAMDINITQDRLPYALNPGKRLPSQKHFAVYADTLVLGGTLVNPGRDIRLYARQLVLEAPAVLDVCGADAGADFAAGVPAPQADTLPGANGDAGADGSDGGNAGAITIYAERIVQNFDGRSDKLAVHDSQTAIQQALQQAFQAASGVNDEALPIDDVELSCDFFGRRMDSSLTDARISGLKNVRLEECKVDDSAGRIILRLIFSDLRLTGVDSLYNHRRSSKAFSATLTMHCLRSSDGRSYRATAAGCSVAQVLLENFNGCELTEAGRRTVEANMPRLIEKTMAAVAEKALQDFLAPLALTLLAQGGRGGRGQDGHAGMKGRKGENGVETGIENMGSCYDGVYSYPSPAVGKVGGKGGKGGDAGHSGKGGMGGSISVNVLAPDAFALMHSVAAGLGGDAAQAGGRGPGGQGGDGAYCILVEMSRGSLNSQKIREQAPDGPDGEMGVEADFKGAPGLPGSAGTPLLLNAEPYKEGNPVPVFSYTSLSAALPLTLFFITQNTAGLAFLNARAEEDFEYARTLYQWLIDCNKPFADGAAKAGLKTEEAKVRSTLCNSAMAEMLRLAQGLDFYGHSYNWAPVLTLKSLEQRCSEIVALGSVIENQFRDYTDTERTLKEKLGALSSAKQQIALKTGNIQAEIKRLDTEIGEMLKHLESYDKNVAAQLDLLNSTEYKFKKELENYLIEQHQTDFFQFMEMLGTVVSCVGGLGGAIGGTVSAFKALNEAESFVKEVKGVVKVLKKVKGGIDNLIKGYKAIKEYATREEPNGAKLLVDSEEFDEMLEEYLGKFPAADELRAAVDHYIELAQARNMAAYNYTALIGQKLSLQKQSEQIQAELPYIDAQAGAYRDTMLPVFSAFMRTAYERVRRDLLRKLYEENRAYEYWSLETDEFAVSNSSIAALAATHERLVADIDAFREANDAFETFTQVVEISAEKFPAAFAALPKQQCLVFELDIRTTPGFANMRHIMVQAFELRFPDITGSGKTLSVSLVHSGLAVFNRLPDPQAAGSLVMFSHKPRAKFFKIDYGNAENKAGGTIGDDSQGYAGLSPFTTWKLDFSLAGNDWLDLKSIQRVVLKLSGRFLGPGIALAAKARPRIGVPAQGDNVGLAPSLSSSP
jgi:flagellar capping protein FliD